MTILAGLIYLGSGILIMGSKPDIWKRTWKGLTTKKEDLKVNWKVLEKAERALDENRRKN